MTCHYCGKELADTVRLCPVCGKDPHPPKKSGFFKQFFGWVLLILSLLSLAGNIMTHGLLVFFELAPAMVLTAVLIILGVNMISRDSKNFLLILLKGFALLMLVVCGFYWLVTFVIATFL